MKLDIDINSMESEMMKNKLVKLFEELEVVSSINEEINGVLYAVGYEVSVLYSKRYHKIAIFGALNTLTFHDSNVIDSTYVFDIKSVVKEVKNTLNHIIKEI